MLSGDRRSTSQQIDLACGLNLIRRAVRVPRRDQQIVVAVTVDVAGRECATRFVTRIDAVRDEVVARGSEGQIHHGGKRGRAEDPYGLAGLGRRILETGGSPRTAGQVS